MSYVFKKTKDKENPYDQTSIKICINSSDATLPDVIQHFECFLRACGFYFDGQLELVEEGTIKHNGGYCEDDDFDDIIDNTEAVKSKDPSEFLNRNGFPETKPE